MMRAWLWFAAGVSAALAALVAGWIGLIRYSLRRWDQETAP